jgi:acetolactate synthase-1/2/3 large subunit
MAGPTIAEAIMERLAARGVRRMFGVPGGDCNLDMIEAGARNGVDFILTRGETAAAIMASVSAELTGVPGVAMTTRGPGLASAVNGAAYATLDRAPLVIIADNYESGLDHVSHQRIDQASLLRPVLKAESRLTSEDPIAEVDALLDIATAQPPGAVYLEITGERVRSNAPSTKNKSAKAGGASVDETAIEAAGKLLSKAVHPVIIAGLQARSLPAAKALRNLAARWKCPVLFTYKAKGAISDEDPYAIGCYIDGAAERPVIEASDLIILFGFDPIEGPATKWRFKKPIIELTEHPFDYPLVKADASLVGDIAQSAERLAGFRTAPAYEVKQLERMKSELRARAASVENARPERRARFARTGHHGICVAGGDRLLADRTPASYHCLYRRRRPHDVRIRARHGRAEQLQTDRRRVQRFLSHLDRSQAAPASITQRRRESLRRRFRLRRPGLWLCRFPCGNT